ncbi:hypothetical protein B0H13DRAFT_2359166 [Mycena leptocephala]|nr:hypothetical protein B0H13DRAFT_2359166 [Mycena leptocephala]
MYVAHPRWQLPFLQHRRPRAITNYALDDASPDSSTRKPRSFGAPPAAAAPDPTQLFNETSSTISGSIMVPFTGTVVYVYLGMVETCLFNVDGTDVGVYMDTHLITSSSRVGMLSTHLRIFASPGVGCVLANSRDLQQTDIDAGQAAEYKSSKNEDTESIRSLLPKSSRLKYPPRRRRRGARVGIHHRRPHNPTSGEVTEINWTFTAKDPATFNLGQIHTLLPTLPAVGGYALHAVHAENVDFILAASPPFAIKA